MLGFAPTGRARLCEPMGAANPRSRSQGDRRNKRPAYVSPYLLRREGRREWKAFNYGYILSTWPWVVGHPRSRCQGCDRRDMFPGTKVPWGPCLRESHLELLSTVSRSSGDSDVSVHPYGSPTNDYGWYHGRSSYSPEGVTTPLLGQLMGMDSWWLWLMAKMLARGPN